MASVGPDILEIQGLITRIESNSMEAIDQLSERVTRAAQPYLNAGVRSADIDAEIGQVVDIVLNVIHANALCHPEALPRLIESLVRSRIGILTSGGNIPESIPTRPEMMA